MWQWENSWLGRINNLFSKLRFLQCSDQLISSFLLWWMICRSQMCCTIIYMPKLILCCSTFNLIRAFSFWLGVSLWVKCIFEAIFAPCSRGQKRKKNGNLSDCRGISIWTQAGLVQTLIYLRRKSFGIIVRLKDEAPPSFEQKPEGFAKTLTGMKNYLPHSL